MAHFSWLSNLQGTLRHIGNFGTKCLFLGLDKPRRDLAAMYGECAAQAFFVCGGQAYY